MSDDLDTKYPPTMTQTSPDGWTRRDQFWWRVRDLSNRVKRPLRSVYKYIKRWFEEETTT